MIYKNSQEAYKALMKPVNCKYGAPMGRTNKLLRCKKSQLGRVFDRKIKMSSCGAYDESGVYWGIGKELRVKYNINLSYVEFYRATYKSGWLVKDTHYDSLPD